MAGNYNHGFGTGRIPFSLDRAGRPADNKDIGRIQTAPKGACPMKAKQGLYMDLARDILAREGRPLPALTQLPPDFYQRTAIEVARDLLGKYCLIQRRGFPQTVCRIVETEAYMGVADKAANTSGGRRTPRTEILYGPGGGVFIYLTYGMYHCLNIVCNRPEIPEAALIRAVEPVQGLDAMCLARFGCPAVEIVEKKGPKTLLGLTNGPGKLCQALGLTRKDSDINLFNSFFHIAEEKPAPDFQMVETTRIGVESAGEDALLPYRYYIAGNPFVSRL